MLAVASAEPPAAADGSPCQMTIEQLAFQSGMSVRNIRSHQARGLLAPPEVRLRVGYYGPEHLAQLRLIRELQDEGFNLGGIKRLLDDTHGTAERLLRFKNTLTSPLTNERAEMLALAERRRNVAGAFAARPSAGAIVLVDDVYTSGATVSAAASALRAAGAPTIEVVTFARTIRFSRAT